MIVQFRCKKTYARYIVVVDGKTVPLEFRGGTIGGGQITYAKYRTNNAKIIEALKNHAEFVGGRMWIDMTIAELGDGDVSASSGSGKVDPAKPIDTEGSGQTGDVTLTGTDAVGGSSAGTVEGSGAGQTGENTIGGTNGHPTPTGPDDKKVVSTFPEVLQAQQARSALKSIGITLPVGSKKEDVIAAGKAAGVEFPNWPDYNA